jgi:hypothetical protein
MHFSGYNTQPFHVICLKVSPATHGFSGRPSASEQHELLMVLREKQALILSILDLFQLVIAGGDQYARAKAGRSSGTSEFTACSIARHR